MVLKLDGKDNIIGLEIISLEKLEMKYLEKLPENIRNILQNSRGNNIKDKEDNSFTITNLEQYTQF